MVPANLPLPHPLGANFFHFTRVGEEVQMLVGSVNLLRLHEASRRPTGDPLVIVPDIVARYTLSPLGLASLQSQLAQLTDRMRVAPTKPRTGP